MTMQAHLSELERKHRALEDEIADAMTHPSTDDLKIAELKRQKLLVKDEIERLRVGDAAQSPLKRPNLKLVTIRNRTAGPSQKGRRCYFGQSENEQRRETSCAAARHG